MESKFAIGVAGLVVMALAGCVTLLSWHGTINGQAAIGFFSGLTLAGIVGGGAHVATRNGARAASEGLEARRGSSARS